MKPKNYQQHKAWMESGSAWPVKVPAPQAFRSPSGDLYFLDDDGKFWDGHMKLLDKKGFPYYGNVPKGGLQKLGNILLGAAGVFVGIRSPQNKALQGVLKLFGSNPDAVVAKVKPLGLDARTLIFIADIVGWDKAAAWGHELQRMAEDGQISVAEVARLHQIRDNRVDPGDPAPPPAPKPAADPDPEPPVSEPPAVAPSPHEEPAPETEPDPAPETPPAAPTPEVPAEGEPSGPEAEPGEPGASEEEPPHEPPDPESA